MKKKLIVTVGLMILVLLTSCSAKKTTKYLSDESFSDGILSDESVLLNASTDALPVRSAIVITDNDTSFEHKLSLIKGAEKTLDLAYYIYSTDYTSAALSEALIEAAKRGVRVRILLDYHSNYFKLDYLTMMEQHGNSGSGSLEFRFYNRPTEILIRDAVYLTMGCSEVMPGGELKGCAAKKYEEINRRFAELKSETPEQAWQRALNYNSGGSGLFLSALYAKDIDLLGFSVIKGQDIDFSAFTGDSSKDEEKEKDEAAESDSINSLLAAGKVYWQSRAANEKKLERTVANLKLGFVFLFYGTQLNPIYDALTAHLPVGVRKDAKEAFRDWDHLTDFLHHKLLLADGKRFQLGGRNIEDSYHMAPHPLVKRYLFMDTDVYVELERKDARLSASFDTLWNYGEMMASLSDVRAHAPNDFLVANKKAKEACNEIDPKEAPVKYEFCYQPIFTQALKLEDRIETKFQDMKQKAEVFRADYQPLSVKDRGPSFEIDQSASVYYVENIPFEHPVEGETPLRTFGSTNGREGESGKYIHSVWRAGLRNACQVATPEDPQKIILHNAYFFLPSNLLSDLGRMVDGTYDCSNVELVILTNSMETTDLNIINVAAAYSLRALALFYAENRDAKRGATVRYYEYLPQGKKDGKSNISLHSKVSVLGPDIFIGSANADARSYMMDSNNGLLVRNASRLLEDYTAWVESILSNDKKVRDRSEFFRTVSREELLAEHRKFFSGVLAGVLPPSMQGSAAEEAILDKLEKVLDSIYSLSVKVLQSGRNSGGAERDMNVFFKLL